MSRGLLLAGLALCIGFGGSGCYYGHLAAGQTKLLWARRDIPEVLADPATDPAVASALRTTLAARRFAAQLGLEVGERYTSYVDWPEDRIITSVVAAEPGRVAARSFRFPIVGAVPYKGFFDRERAEREAASLRAEGLDVCVSAIPAYSTLGWFSDPVTTPMLRRGEAVLVETVLHELVHATVFLKSEPDFNESVASFIGEEAAMRFDAWRAEAIADIDSAEATLRAQQQRERIADDRRIATALLDFRDEVEALYEGTTATASVALERQTLEARGRERFAALPLTLRDASALAPRLRLNDACLALTGTYAAEVPAHARVLRALGDDLAAFVAHLVASAEAEDPLAEFFAPSAESPATQARDAARAASPSHP